MSAYLTAATVFRNETRYLREWIEYHLLVGFERLVLVNNDDKEEAKRAQKVLAPYVTAGLVEEIRYASRTPSWELEAIAEIVGRVRGRTEWLLITDADAFLFPLQGLSVTSIIRDYCQPNVAGLAVYLATFGMGGVERSPALQTQAFLHRAPTEAPCNWTANFLIRPTRMQPASVAIGYCEPLPGYVIVDEAHKVVGTQKRPGPQQRLRLNHYSIRSAEDWDRKVQRGWPEIEPTWPGPGTVANHKRAMLDRNEVFDDSMLRFREALSQRLELTRN